MVAMGLGQAVPGSAILSARILGFVFATQAAAAWFLGTPILRAGSFAFGFLVFMVPLPGAAIDLCETQLQHASAVASEWLFLATGVAHIRDGQFFQLPGITIEVAQECSGFRSTLVLLIVSVVAARMFLLSTWRRLALVLVIIPLGILRNGFRIWVLAVLTVNVDSRVIDSPLHHQGGPIFFVLSLGPLFGFLWLLYRMERSLRGDSSSASVPN
jgi:exosortase